MPRVPFPRALTGVGQRISTAGVNMRSSIFDAYSLAVELSRVAIVFASTTGSRTGRSPADRSSLHRANRGHGWQTQVQEAEVLGLWALPSPRPSGEALPEDLRPGVQEEPRGAEASGLAQEEAGIP
jgi:hypothetical protein